MNTIRGQIKRIEKSGLFDMTWYLSEYPDVEMTGLHPIEHYLEYGWLLGRNPSLSFNGNQYLESNTDVFDAGLNPLIHYLETGNIEGRKLGDTSCSSRDLKSGKCSEILQLDHEPRIHKTFPSNNVNEKSIKDDYTVIQTSGLFDNNYYTNTYPDIKDLGISPIEHFCIHGWKEHRNPNRDFNTKYYLEKYSDVFTSGMNPLTHWISHGKSESRKTNLIEVVTKTDFNHNKPSIIFVSHDASRTGAPAVLLTLMKWVKSNTDITFSIIIGQRGPWNNRFEELAPCFYMDEFQDQDITKELHLFCGKHVQVVYANTIATGLYIEKLSFLNAEFIAHVHEMEYGFSVFEPHFEVMKKMCTKFIAVSQGTVNAIKKRTDFEQIETILLKPFIEEKKDSPVKIPKPTNKKIIFGCGPIESRKGFDLFCEVGAEILKRGSSNFKMYWIGSADNTDLQPQQEINKRNLQHHVEWLGTKEYPRDYFSWGDIFLLPSREDPYPLVCMEASECQMPVICFDEQAGGIHRFVEHDAGIVVPYLNINAMADAVISLLENDNERKRMGDNALEKVKSHHYVDIIAPQILEHLPAITNSESTTELDSYKELIDTAKIVSFDIFDTLVTRKINDPNVVFDVIEYKHTQNESAPLPLFNERMNTAGQVLGSYQGMIDDISIDEIYENMSFYKNSSFEKDTEIQMCVPHPLGIQLYQYALSRNKRIYITSDMYLDKLTIEQILKRCGLTHWDELFLSSIVGKKKDTGRLYQHLLRKAEKENILANDILHIGDNWKSDIHKAKAAGIKPIRFSPLYEEEHKLFSLDSKTKSKLSQIGRIWDSFCTQATNLWHESPPCLPGISILN